MKRVGRGKETQLSIKMAQDCKTHSALCGRRTRKAQRWLAASAELFLGTVQSATYPNLLIMH